MEPLTFALKMTRIRSAANSGKSTICSLRQIARFPSAGLTRERILFTYSGVRPLPWTRNEDEQSITRRHFIREHPRLKNLLSIVGGKLTTYRSLAEECVDLDLSQTRETFAAMCVLRRKCYRRDNCRFFDLQRCVLALNMRWRRRLADCFLRRTMSGLNGDLGLRGYSRLPLRLQRLLAGVMNALNREIENYKREIKKFRVQLM